MNTEEKYLARIFFRNKIYSADGQAFEDLFTQIMSYAYDDFQQIKPWGKLGDRKSDGHRTTENIYYQVYAPEDNQKSYHSVVEKIQRDFCGLIEYWNPVREFYFVLNDKFNGVNPQCAKIMQQIKSSYGLNEARLLTAKDLENILFRLNDDEIFIVTGSIPAPDKIKSLDYSVLKEVIDHVMQLSRPIEPDPNLTLPDWGNKIKFNGLTRQIASFLEAGYIQIHSLEEYLKNNSNFLSDSLRDQLNKLYLQEKEKYSGDQLFCSILNSASPRKSQAYQSAVIVIMAKYFETCDIFENPEEK
ncbi:MAG: ABC-three component system protein [Candidatus Omnitrophota bacterium]